jgi:hypothetical protein
MFHGTTLGVVVLGPDLDKVLHGWGDVSVWVALHRVQVDMLPDPPCGFPWEDGASELRTNALLDVFWQVSVLLGRGIPRGRVQLLGELVLREEFGERLRVAPLKVNTVVKQGFPVDVR